MAKTTEPKIIRADKRAGPARTFVVALVALLALLTGTTVTAAVAGAEDSSTDTSSSIPAYVPESLNCIMGLTGLAGTAFLAVATPPAGLFVVLVNGALAGGALFTAIDACGSWWTRDL